MAEFNPLIPAAQDAVWVALVVLALAIAVLALVSLARAAKRLTNWQALAWTVIVLSVPALGPLAWLLVGRRVLTTQRSS